jgi:hypothetical protein
VSLIEEAWVKKKADFKKRPQDQIFKFHISLPGTDPLVWRRVHVPGLFTLEALNSVFQLVMGWQMKHLYDFKIGNVRYSDPDEYDDTAKSPYASIAAAVGEQKSFQYTYDFGDDWQHEVIVEETVSCSELSSYPVCVGGENACPPEDCHGVPGYADLLKVIADPEHPEFKDMMRWLGGYFNPASFDPNRINRDMLWLIDWKKGPNDQGLYLPFNFTEE